VPFNHYQLNPQATASIEDLKHLFNKNHRLLIGGKERLFIKQCCYLLLEENDLGDFPPPFFIEREIEAYLPTAAQLSAHQIEIMNFLEPFRGMHIPFVFYETESFEIGSDEKNLSRIFSDVCKNIILYSPFESLEGMKKALSVHQDWREKGLKAIFLSPHQLKLI